MVTDAVRCCMLRSEVDLSGGGVLTAVTAIGGLLGLIFSLLLLAKQTRDVSEQVRASNTLNATHGLDHTLQSLREIYFKMMEHPGARAYFYDNKPCPEAGEERERVLLLAELFADMLTDGLNVTSRIPGTVSHEGWSDYCKFIRDNSPVMQSLINEHPNWWPGLAALD
ncbi:hypothetical protein JCM4814A_27890 [Streptomyces phaeofaciens JCM 4814]|uniref:Uncharacterized protein n=1 Tax=Streptomyces phaeofaciens TaxID=68254 RepID=A0A918H5C5_9ACTN|nr:hypothetical protein GCM10010226_13230 [Streptomyces phaeofaciens]